MKRPICIAVVAAVIVTATGCYRTTYTNLHPPSPVQEQPAAPLPRPQLSSWKHFFIWGWVPSEMVIPVDQDCAGAGGVKEIRTRQTFVQGLIEAFAGYYINICAPWTAEVVCANQPAVRVR
jgi:hypothetical protein